MNLIKIISYTEIIKELTGINNISTVPKIEDIKEYDLNELNKVLYEI